MSFSFAEAISKWSYGRSPDVNDPLNNNPDWKDGYTAGFSFIDVDKAIREAWHDYNLPFSGRSKEFKEWKIGFWAGRFAKIDDDLKRKTANEKATP